MNEQAVTLRTGVESHGGLVAVTMIALKDLMEANPIALYELVEISRDPEHRLFGNTGQILKDHALIEETGHPHRATKEIILAAAVGDGMDLALQSPLRES